ncbi:TniQ family protein [Rhodococcus sp. 14-2483-1-2]|uniref:TniQ family protein n=1 Tax=Rhodococcus sp. 14-2483-1-2 TaxID=2023147 RepID=UPI00207B2B0B|nr:TniQ family protein [Rhodococcus sp. 14-2483-1-2]
MTRTNISAAQGEFDDGEHRPWPLHPQPLPGETVSSWLARTSELYSMITRADLLDSLGLDTTGVDLDRFIPEPVLTALAGKGACTVDRLREMTLAGYTPWLLDSTDPTECDFDTYVHQFSVLLPPGLAVPDRYRRRPPVGTWLPWVSALTTRACPLCIDALDTDADIVVTMAHQYPMLTSCTKHLCRLEFCTVIPGRLIFWERTPAGSDDHAPPLPVPAAVAEIDRRSVAALTNGSVELGVGRVHAAVWFRLLRTVVDEVVTPLIHAGWWARGLRAIWESTGRSRPLQTSRVPFENLSWDGQAAVLAAAATAIIAVENDQIFAGGADACLLQPRPYEPVDPGTAPTRSHFQARAHSAWDDVVAAIDAAVAEARVNSDAARSLFGFARTGCRTEDDVDELAYAFLELGIRLDWA